MSANFLSALAIVTAELEKLSNKEAQDLITMVGSVRNLRVVSAYRPIGTILPRPPATIAAGRRTTVISDTRPPKMAWKQSPQFTELTNRRSAVVEKLKALDPSSIEKGSLTSELRSIELELRLLKQSLNVEPAGRPLL